MFRRRRDKFILITIVISGLLILMLSLLERHLTSGLYAQQMAKRWEQGHISYAQVSAFFAESRQVQEEGINGMRNAISLKLNEDGYHISENNGRTWIDAYSGESQLVLRKDENYVDVLALGVGGEFFQFHPIPLLSGNYLSAEELNADRIMIDNHLAWELFGSYDVVGMSVWIGERLYVVAGVTALPEDSLSKLAYGNSYRIYMNYAELKLLNSNTKITCYEAVLPNPITNYGVNVLKQACGIDVDSVVQDKKSQLLQFGDCEVKENSSRYKASSLLNQLSSMPYRSMRTNAIVYPYWENEAVVIEERLAYILFIKIALAIVVFILSLYLVVSCRRGNKIWKRKLEKDI